MILVSAWEPLSEPMASMSEIEGIEIPTSSGTNQNLGKSMAYRTPEQTKTDRVVMGHRCRTLSKASRPPSSGHQMPPEAVGDAKGN